MIEPQYTSDDIKVIDAMTAIRIRPELYVGPLDDAAAINTLLTEAMCIALDNITSGCANEVAITIHDDGSATVRDNGPGLNVDSVREGMTAIEMLLTQIYACREAKRNRIAAELCGAGIVVTNALSEWLEVETVQDGWLWHQRYIRGHADRPIEKLRECTDIWQQIRFRPDPEIFGSKQLSPSYFIQWFQQQPIVLGSAAVTLHHGNSSTPLRAAS
jgi:DNA gyrase/topoisomerase IV subunit B